MSDHAEAQARAQVRSITEMVAALECDYDRLQELRERLEGLSDDRAFLDAEDREELEQLEAAAGECKDADEARERIQEDALSVEVREGWHSPGEEAEPEEFRIVLCTGGPHVEIVGDLGQHNEPESVRILYRDWGTSAELFDFDRDAVLTYCQQFYFGD